MASVPASQRGDQQQTGRQRNNRWAYSLGALFSVLTAFCLYQAYRTNQQILKYYTPAPEVEYQADVVPYEFTDADFVHPFDPRPATVQLQDRVHIITNRIADLQRLGRTGESAKLQSRLDAALANREGPYPIDGLPQVHALGIYRGSPRVRVTYTGAPIVLALTAYERVRWQVEVAPGVQLRKVIATGYKEQTVEGLPDGVPVEGHVSTGRPRDYQFYACRPVEAHWAGQRLEELTGIDVATFQTVHNLSGEALLIGPGNAEWTAAMALRALDPLYQEAVREERDELARQLVQHSFPEIHCVYSRRHYDGFVANFAVHSIFGPYKETMRSVKPMTASLAVDPRGPCLYSFNSQLGALTVDPESGAVEKWPVAGLDLQPHHNACLAFDTKRQRLLVWGGDLFRGGDLAAINVLKREATIVRRGIPAVCALTYCERDDLLYACFAPYDGDSSNVLISEIRAYNQYGAEVSRTPLSIPIPGPSVPFRGGTAKIAFVGDKLLIMNLGAYDSNSKIIPFDTNYVVDPQTGKVLFACRRKPR